MDLNQGRKPSGAATSGAAVSNVVQQSAFEFNEALAERRGAPQSEGAIEAQLVEWIKCTVKSNNELVQSLERWLDSHAMVGGGRVTRDEAELLADTRRALDNAAIAKRFLVDPIGRFSD